MDEPEELAFRSPCCGVTSVPAGWQVDLARRHTNGVLRLACGMNATGGCGKVFVVTIEPRPGRTA